MRGLKPIAATAVSVSLMCTLLTAQDCAPGAPSTCTNCVFHIDDVTLLTGATGVEISVLADNDICLFGYSVALTSGDTSKLVITGVDKSATVASDASFFEGGVSPDGAEVGYGVVFDYGDFTTKNLPPGSDAAVLVITADVVATMDTSTMIEFPTSVQIDDVSPQPIKNVMTNVEGQTIHPDTVPGTITIRTEAPVIDSVTPDTGAPGDPITIAGDYFDHDGLEVRVCDTVVAPSSATKTSIDLMVPDCDLGCTDVVVSTVRGSDTETDGFCYECPPPDVTGVEPDSGTAGDQITISGSDLDCAGLTVTICGLTAEIVSSDAASIVVRVPECAEEGATDVTVTHDTGTDTAVDAFTYVTGGIAFLRGDDNNDGTVNIADAQYSLNYQFLGGPLPPCMAAADVNNDGNVNIADAQFSLNYQFLGGPSPAPPFVRPPNCERTADSRATRLGCETSRCSP